MKYDYEPLIDDFFEYAYPLALDAFKEKSSYGIGYTMYNDGIDFSFDLWEEYEHSKLKPIFESDYNLLTENKNYFFGCGFDVYIKTYAERLNSFFNEFPDAGEIDFCEYELEKKVYYIMPELLEQKIGFSIKKRNDFLNDKKAQLTTQLQQSETKQTKEINSLKWQGTPLQFTELTKALIQSNLISPELFENERFKRMREFFNVDTFDEGDKLKEIRKRTNTTTPLLNILETSLNNWIKNKD
jgi:hypothetical protein